MTKNLATLLCILMIGPLLMASTAVNGMTATHNNEARQALLDKFSGTLATTFQTNLYEFKDEANKTFNNVTSASLKYKADFGLTSGVSFVVDKNLRNERKQSVRDPIISFSYPVYKYSADTENVKVTKKKTNKTKSKSKKTKLSKLKKNSKEATKTTGDTFSISLNGSLAVPLSDRSKKETELRTSVSAGPTLVYAVNNDSIKGLTLAFAPRIKAYSHEFKVDTSGRSNTSYSTTSIFSISYALLESLSISFNNIYARAWTYDGEYNDQFSFDQSISLSLAKGFSLSAGHAIGGSALDVNGQDSNLKAFDSRESEIYTGISYSF